MHFYGTISVRWTSFFQNKAVVSNTVRTLAKESQFLSENVDCICFSFPQSYYLRTAFEQTKWKTWEY